MKHSQLTISGFRGFNETRCISLNEKLTLIYAPNSYGKTSISEAVEWLLYGVTSRVENADSKEEYKDCYRNRHYPQTETPSVEAVINRNGTDVTCRAELAADNTPVLYLDGTRVQEWPFLKGCTAVQKPFILQHALKNLLLAKPDERFQGFAALLGLQDLDRLQKDFASFCTKPEAHLPPAALSVMRNAEAMLTRVSAQPKLTKIAKAFKKGSSGLKEAYEEVLRECSSRVPPGTDETSILPGLLKIREDAIGRLFKGRVSVGALDDKETPLMAETERFLVGTLTDSFIKDYLTLAEMKAVGRIREQAAFFEIGSRLLEATVETCPFCGQKIEGDRKEHIAAEATRALEAKRASTALAEKRDAVLRTIHDLKARAADFLRTHTVKCSDLLSAAPNLPKLKVILGTKHAEHYTAVASALPTIKTAHDQAELSDQELLAAIEATEQAITRDEYEAATVEKLGTSLVAFVKNCRNLRALLDANSTTLRDAHLVLEHELDAAAGTEDIAVLVALVEQRTTIKTTFRIKQILEGVKDLRKLVDQTVAQIMLDTINMDLTTDVMAWYNQIRTTGDPDVHFSGFDMEKTASGTFKARRVSVKAQSYGKDLASAVSSLSESKLNALGLCVSIAANLKGQSPYDFLVIDDPIQSWDADHETQFVNVLRNLIGRGKQIILLSHNKKWLDVVRAGLRSLNGWYYEITGYDIKGPHIAPVPWATVDERLKEVDAISKDVHAPSVRIEQGEEEIRILVCEITAALYEKAKGERKNPNTLNSDKVRKLLIECGLDSSLIDRISKTFATTDDAHHANPTYAPNRERLRQYIGYIHELRKTVPGTG